MWKREGRGALPRPATWAADTVVARCSTVFRYRAMECAPAELPRACQRLWVFWGDISQDLPILDRRKERLERLEHKHHVVLSFTPVGRFGFWAPQIFVREDRCPSLSVPCPAHVRLSLQAPGRVEVAGRCADQRRWRCLPSSNHPVPQINPTAHALIVLHKDSVKQCGCHWSRRR